MRRPHSRGRSGAGTFLSYFEPPGAVGGMYGSGCFHFCSSFSVSVRSTYRATVSNLLTRPSQEASYSLLSGVSDVLVGVEERSNVHGLSPPQIALHRPVECELQRSSVQRPVGYQHGCFSLLLIQSSYLTVFVAGLRADMVIGSSDCAGCTTRPPLVSWAPAHQQSVGKTTGVSSNTE